MRVKVFSFALCLCLLAASCAPNRPMSPTGRVDFDRFLAQRNQARREVPPWAAEEKAACAPPQRSPEILSEDEVRSLLEPGKEEEEIATEQAKADVTLYFRALRAAYGAYAYFGGDEVFFPLRDDLLDRLDKWDTVSVRYLKRALVQALEPVIQDGHFCIDGAPLLTKQTMYSVPDLYISKGETSHPELERPTIGPDGALSWCLSSISVDGAELPTEAEVRGQRVSLAWKQAADFLPKTYPAYETRRRGDIPILVCRTLASNPETESDLTRLAASGGQWSQTPLFLLDLRSNLGGSDGYAFDWVAGLTAQAPSYKILHRNRLSPLIEAAYPGANLRDQLLVMDAAALPCDATVFLLQDRGTGSAGESFVAMMRGVDNTVTVGSNTQGCTMMGNVMDLYLPNSGISVRFGAGLSFVGTLENMEGRGHLPDLWVPPQEAEEAVLRLIGYYGLK